MIFGPSYPEVLERAATSTLCTPTQCVDEAADLIPMTFPTRQDDMALMMCVTFVIVVLAASRPRSLRSAKPLAVRIGRWDDDATSR